MRAQAKVTSKGQITVPVEVRRELGIDTGDMLVFEVGAGYVTLTKRRSAAELMTELRDRYPELRDMTVPEDTRTAITERVDEKLRDLHDEERYADQYFIAGRGSSKLPTAGEPA